MCPGQAPGQQRCRTPPSGGHPGQGLQVPSKPLILPTRAPQSLGGCTRCLHRCALREMFVHETYTESSSKRPHQSHFPVSSSDKGS